MAAIFSITLDRNFSFDTGRKLEKISKSRDGFFSRGDNTAFFMELGTEAELNERFTTLLMIGSKKKNFQAAKIRTDVSYLIQCVIQTLVQTFQIQQDNCSSSLHADFDSIYIATDLNI